MGRARGSTDPIVSTDRGELGLLTPGKACGCPHTAPARLDHTRKTRFIYLEIKKGSHSINQTHHLKIWGKNTKRNPKIDKEQHQ